MKTTYYFLLVLFLSLTSCEKVIDVDLTTADPKLVIGGSIQWKNDTDGSEQSIRLSTTTDYFSTTIPPVTGALVTIINNNSNQLFTFLEEEKPGLYRCHDFVPIIGDSYTLTVTHDNEVYTATEKLLNTPIIKRVEQKNDGGILGDDIEIKFFFDDIVNETNYYFLRIDDPYKVIPEYGVLEDRFFQNNEMFSLYFSEDLKPGDTLTFTLNSITLNYYNYMNILLEQTGSGGAGPFGTPTSTVRGNIINQTNFSNFALGYFRLSKTETKSYIIQ